MGNQKATRFSGAIFTIQNNKKGYFGGIILTTFIICHYNKKIALFFSLILFFFSFLLASVLVQGAEVAQEKQLKIFQLSYLLEEENEFPRQNSYFINALAYYNNKHYSMAINELEKIEYSNLYIPLFLRSQLLRGQAYEKLQRWESAVYIYQNLYENIPLMQDYSAYYLAKTYLSMRDTKAAVELFQKIVQDYPDSALIPRVRYQNALIYLEEGYLDSFLEECNLAIDTAIEKKFKAVVLTRMTDVLWENGQLINSLIYLQDLIENRYDTERIAGYENLFVKRYQLARRNENIEMPPDLILFCAGIYFNYRQYEVAESLYDEVIALYPEQKKMADIHYNKARAIHYQGEYERAIEQCIYILENFQEPEDIIIRTVYLYAGGLLSSGNRNLALEKYREIIEKYPESYFAPSSYLRLSEIEFLQKREKEGIEILDRLIADYPKSSQAREASWKLARYYTNRDENNNALQYYKIICDNFSESSQGDDALYWFGKLQASLDKQEGYQVYRRLLNKYPDSYYTFHLPAEIKLETSDISKIITDSREISLAEFKNNYIPVDKQAQLAIYKAELLKTVGTYQESAVEIINALNNESDNVYLIYLLTELYHQDQEYYQSIGWAQTLLDYFLNNDMIKEMPFKIWQYVFPENYFLTISTLAANYGLDPFLVLATIKEESHFNSYSESRAGARGLMQIVLSTGEWIAQKLDYQKFDYDLLFEPEVNIHFGCWYLNYLQEKYNKNYYLMISGYNAGPGVTDGWLEQFDINDIDSFVENIPYPETTEHIKKVMRTYNIYKIIYDNLQ
jgi:soluble lytic murein transglycosylase